METTFRSFWGKFWKSEDGNVLPMMAIATLVLAALIGGGVDMSRAYLTKNRLQNACDAGVLAGRRAVTTNGFDQTAKDVAADYFDVNFANVTDVSHTLFAPSTSDNGNTIDGTASTKLKMTIMNMFGFSSMDISSDCTASMSMGNADIVMVLDVTGSMDWAISGSDSTKRMDALQDAMKGFYTSLDDAVAGTNARIRYGFVPYSQTVNVGYLLTAQNPDWVTSVTPIQSREWGYNYYGNIRHIYREVDLDTSRYKLGNAVSLPIGENGATVTSTWAGCIEERQTVSSGYISYNSITGFTPSGLHDLDIDGVPTNDATRWKPYWPEVTYRRTNYYGNATSASASLYGTRASAACPRRAQLLAKMTKSEFNNYADALNPTGGTYHDIGMIWGARLISPTGLFASNVNQMPANGGKVGKHIIFMTDGELQTSWASKSAWGVEYHDRRVTDNGYSDNDQRHDQRLRAMCSAIKGRGVRVWVIAFATSLTPSLTHCASPNSSFTPDTASALNIAFQEIARDIGELRIVQ